METEVMRSVYGSENSLRNCCGQAHTAFGITHLNGSSTREGLELVGWTLKVNGKTEMPGFTSKAGSSKRRRNHLNGSSVKRGLAGPGSLQLGRPGSRPATCRLEALGPLAWFTLGKPSCCKQHLALGLSMEVQRRSLKIGSLDF